MLAVVDVAIGVQQLADRATDSLGELALENDTGRQQKVTQAVEFVILKATTIAVTI